MIYFDIQNSTIRSSLNSKLWIANWKRNMEKKYSHFNQHGPKRGFNKKNKTDEIIESKFF
jgi:hypothetical protein